jgi:YfiH family protein
MLTIPRFDQVPSLVHGFGDGALTTAGLKDLARRGSFHMIVLRQVHSDIVRFLETAPEESLRGDALVTNRAGLLLVIKTADCLPVLLVDGDRRVIAAAHCGRRGTLHGVLEKTVTGMRERFGCDPRTVLAGLGPCIGPDCYEVGDDVRGQFARAGFPARLFRPVPARSGKYLFDLAAANRLQLLRSGVDEKNVFSAGVCSHCDPRYPSFRRDRRRAGRMLSFIGLLPPGQNQRE